MGKNILSRNDIAALEGIAKTHFLNTNAQRINKSLGDLTGLSQLGFHIIEIAPGFDSTELHRHHHEEECIYILAGTAEAHSDDTVTVVGEGDFIACPAGGPAHKLVNCGDSILRCIVVGQRLDHDVVDYPNQKKRLYRHKGMAWNLVDTDAITEPQAGKKT